MAYTIIIDSKPNWTVAVFTMFCYILKLCDLWIRTMKLNIPKLVQPFLDCRNSIDKIMVESKSTDIKLEVVTDKHTYLVLSGVRTPPLPTPTTLNMNKSSWLEKSCQVAKSLVVS